MMATPPMVFPSMVLAAVVTCRCDTQRGDQCGNSNDRGDDDFTDQRIPPISEYQGSLSGCCVPCRSGDGPNTPLISEESAKLSYWRARRSRSVRNRPIGSF